MSLAVLTLCLPILVIIALLVRFDSPGPVIFVQTRVGRYGAPFRFYKFRTMHADARARFPELYEYSYRDAEDFQRAHFKRPDDPRLTRLGRRLRTTSLDELPNFINVLLGDMTLVGPRPEIPAVVGYYAPEQLPKFGVKPGITGLCQVRGRAMLSYRETIAADLEYVRRRSFVFDLVIMAQTVGAVVRRAGAF